MIRKKEKVRIPLQRVTDSEVFGENYTDPFLEKTKNESKFKQLYKFPFKCPIGKCRKTLGSTSLMSHVVLDHTVYGIPLEVQEIYLGKRTVVPFYPASVTAENTCLGILAYGGVGKSAKSPMERGICLANTFLPSNYRSYKEHLTILVMASKVSFFELFGKAPDNLNTNDPNLSEVFLWLISEETSKPLHCILTAKNDTETLSKSTLVKINQVCKTHDAMLLKRFKNCGIHLSNGLCRKYTSSDKGPLHIEIAIQEIYPDQLK